MTAKSWLTCEDGFGEEAKIDNLTKEAAAAGESRDGDGAPRICPP
jgi:hypothetical protein